MRNLLIAALMFSLLVVPSFIYPAPSEPSINHHPLSRTLKYYEPTVTRVSSDEGFLNFSSYHVHFYVIGSGNESMLFLPGFGRTAEETKEFLLKYAEEIPLTVYIIDPPGMGESNGPVQNQYALTGNGSVESVYFRRYARYGYEFAKYFNVTYVAGASLGGITTFILGYFLDDVKAIVPIMSAGYREFSMSRGEAINRFIRDPEAHRVVEEFDPAVFAPYIKVPVYMIVGAEDEVFDPYTFYRTYRNLPSPKHIIVIPGIGHGGHKEYVEAFLARYYAMNGETSVKKSETFYIGGIHEITSSIPYGSGLKIITLYNEHGPFSSYVEEYTNRGAIAGYLIVLLLSLGMLYHLGERRIFVYASAFSFLPRAYSPHRFAIISMPTMPLLFVLSALLLLLMLKKPLLAIVAYVPRIILGDLLQILVLPGPFLCLMMALGIYEYFYNKK